jgi:pyruvate/2-oxoglutarate/acetoin dehydrogenase E1 component
MKYFDELKKSMEFLGVDNKTFFIGQAVEYAGTAMTNTLKEISPNQKIELPVAEEMQMGMTLGMAMDGSNIVSIFPRWNFMLYSINQLINHIDKYKIMNGNNFNGKIIIRTSIGSERPLHPQFQHIGDYTDSIRQMSKNIDIIKLKEPEDIFTSYKKAYSRIDGKTTILVEYGDYYNEK